MLLSLLFACSEIDDSCSRAKDGVCDELQTCPLGTDSTDCNLACEELPWSLEIAGACAHDLAGLEPESQMTAGAGTEGKGGLTGIMDETIQVRSAAADELIDRYYRLYVPRRYNPERPTPVLFALGGFSVDMYWMQEFTELYRLADREDIIVVFGHPEWRDFGSYDVFAWYTYNRTVGGVWRDFEGEWVDNPDIAYMAGIVERLSGLYNVDRSRIYVSGHSRGGALSMIAAFERPDLFAGFSPQAGFLTANDYDLRIEDLAETVRPAGYIIHGDQDPDVPVSESDTLVDILETQGWEEGEQFVYQRIPGAKHEWQSHFNQEMWDFLYSHPNQLGGE